MPDPLSIVDHLTIAGFIRRLPHQFTINEIHWFGPQIIKSADALGVCFAAMPDGQLGQVRIFPVPLMERVYQICAAQRGWKPLPDNRALPDPADSLRNNERTRRRLEEAAEGVDDPNVVDAMRTVMSYLENDARKLRGEAPVQPTVLRPVT